MKQLKLYGIKMMKSVVDIVGVIAESKDGRKYWNKLK